MPELPDVEVYRRYVNATALHQAIEGIHVSGVSLLHGTSPQALGRALKRRQFVSTRRHGKYLFLAVDQEAWLVLHFGMTGELEYFGKHDGEPRYTQFLIDFDNGFRLAYIAPRKLGRIELTDSPENFVAGNDLGVDALDVTAKQFLTLAKTSRGGVKAWLMNQGTMAGIGNIYSDEILFQAGVHPRHSLADLGEDAMKRLFKAMRSVLNAAIKAGADPGRMPSTFLLPHRTEGGRCPKCHGPVKSVKASGRSAWYCPHCQAP